MSGPYEFKYYWPDAPKPDAEQVAFQSILDEIDWITEQNWLWLEFNHDVLEWLMKQHIPGYEPQPYMRPLRSL